MIGKMDLRKNLAEKIVFGANGYNEGLLSIIKLKTEDADYDHTDFEPFICNSHFKDSKFAESYTDIFSLSSYKNCKKFIYDNIAIDYCDDPCDSEKGYNKHCEMIQSFNILGSKIPFHEFYFGIKLDNKKYILSIFSHSARCSEKFIGKNNNAIANSIDVGNISLVKELQDIDSLYLIVFFNTKINNVYFNLVKINNYLTLDNIKSLLTKEYHYGVGLQTMEFASIVDSLSKECIREDYIYNFSSDQVAIDNKNFDELVDWNFRNSLYTKETAIYDTKHILTNYNISVNKDTEVSYINRTYYDEKGILKFALRDDLKPKELICKITYINGYIANLVHILKNDDYTEIFEPLGALNGPSDISSIFSSTFSSTPVSILSIENINSYKTLDQKKIHDQYYHQTKSIMRLDLNKLFFAQELKDYFGITQDEIKIVISNSSYGILSENGDLGIDILFTFCCGNRFTIDICSTKRNSDNPFDIDKTNNLYRFFESSIQNNIASHRTGRFFNNNENFSMIMHPDYYTYNENGLAISKEKDNDELIIKSIYHTKGDGVYMRNAFGIPSIYVGEY